MRLHTLYGLKVQKLVAPTLLHPIQITFALQERLPTQRYFYICLAHSRQIGRYVLLNSNVLKQALRTFILTWRKVVIPYTTQHLKSAKLQRSLPLSASVDNFLIWGWLKACDKSRSTCTSLKMSSLLDRCVITQTAVVFVTGSRSREERLSLELRRDRTPSPVVDGWERSQCWGIWSPSSTEVKESDMVMVLGLKETWYAIKRNLKVFILKEHRFNFSRLKHLI